MTSGRLLAFLTFVTIVSALGNAAYADEDSSSQPISSSSTVPVDSPERWDAAVFLPPAAFNSILTSFAGSSVVIPVANGPDVQVTLVGATTKLDYETGNVQVEIAAGLLAGGPRVSLTAIATLRFAGFERETNGDKPEAKFTVEVESLKTGAKAGALTIAGADLLPMLNKADVAGFLSKWLSFDIPIPLDISADTGLDADVPFSAKSGKVLLHIKAPDVRVSKKLTNVEAVFVPAGVWLCVEYNGIRPPSPPGEKESPAAKRLKLYQDDGKAGVPRVLLRGGFVESIINELGALPDRTVNVNGKTHQGNLVDGATTVWLYNDDENGSLTITPSATWTKSGLRVTCSYAAEAHADIAFNFKIPGGSVGSKVHCDTNSCGKVEGGLQSSIVTRSEPTLTKKQASAVILIPTFANGQEIKGKLETDGTFKTKLPFGAWFKSGSPKVTVEAELPVPPDILPNLFLLTNEPHSIDIAKPPELPSGWKVIPPKGGFPTHLVLQPQQAAWGETTYALAFTVALERLTPEEAQARKDVLDHLLAPAARPSIQLGRITVSVAGIGPNNDIVKALIALAKGVGDACADAKKDGQNVEATIAEANQDISRQVNRSADDVAREFDRASGNVQRETGKGAHNTVKTLGKAATDATNGVANFFHHTFR